MKQVKEDMEFQIEGLLYINRELEKTVTHAKKKAKELIQNENKSIITILFLFTFMVYFYPVWI